MEARTRFAAIIAILAIVTIGPTSGRCVAAPMNVYRDYAAGVPVIVVEIDLNQPQARVTGALAAGGSGHAESWHSLIERTRPLVAITGTYFDIASRLPIGDLFIDGRLAHFGGKGSALCVTPDNHATFMDVPQYKHIDWSPYDFVIRSGPRLVVDGAPRVHMSAEGFADPALMRPTGRLGIGITRWNRLLLVGTREPVTLMRWAMALRAAGAWNAMNLDAGPSMALYIDGRTIFQPKTPLTNLVLVYSTPTRLLAHVAAEALKGGAPRAVAMGQTPIARNSSQEPASGQPDSAAPPVPAQDVLPESADQSRRRL